MKTPVDSSSHLNFKSPICRIAAKIPNISVTVYNNDWELSSFNSKVIKDFLSFIEDLLCQSLLICVKWKEKNAQSVDN